MRTSADVLRSLIRYSALMLGDEWEVRPWGTEGEFKFPFARVAVVAPPVVTTGPAHTSDMAMTLAIHAYPIPGSTPDESIMEVERVKELFHLGIEVGFGYTDDLVPPAVVQATPLPINGALAADVWHYAVTAITATGESLPSAEVVASTTGSSGSVILLWTPVTGARSYRLYRRSIGTPGPLRLLVELAQPSFVDAGLVATSGTNPPTTTTATTTVRSSKKRIPLYDYVGVPLDGATAFSNTRHANDYFNVTDCPIDQGVDPEDETQFRVIAQPRVTWRRPGSVPSGHKVVTEVRLQPDPVS